MNQNYHTSDHFHFRTESIICALNFLKIFNWVYNDISGQYCILLAFYIPLIKSCKQVVCHDLCGSFYQLDS